MGLAGVMRPQAACVLGLLLVTTGLAGCTADTEPACTPRVASPGAQPVCFLTADGWVIQGVEWNPNATDAPSALLVHGFREQHAQYDALATRLAEDGFRVLAIDLRGHGQSTRYTRGPDPPIDAFGPAEIAAMRNDLNASQAYLGQAPDAVVGASVGANLALTHGADEPAVETLVLLSPIPARGALEPTRANEAYESSVLYIASDQDTRAAKTARDLSASHEGGPAELAVYNGTAHGTQHLDNATRLDRVHSWILDHVPDEDAPGGDASAHETRSGPGLAGTVHRSRLPGSTGIER